jgi:hypothetical protein
LDLRLPADRVEGGHTNAWSRVGGGEDGRVDPEVLAMSSTASAMVVLREPSM